MEDLLNKEPVKRVQEFISNFDPELKVLVGLANEETCTIFSKMTRDIHVASSHS